MRVSITVLICLLFLLGPAAAEDGKEEEPKKPAKEMTEAEREAALKRAADLHVRALSLYRAGKYQSAIPLARRCLSIRQEILGPDHRHVATSLSNLATYLGNYGAYDESRRLHERALAIRERVLGSSHADVASSLNNLAVLLHGLGAYEDALRLCERALKMRREILGPEHPHVASTINTLAMVKKGLGQYGEARTLLEHALHIHEKTQGPRHQSVATDLLNLGSVLRTLGLHEQAEPFVGRALSIYEETMGPDHIYVAKALNMEALLLQDREEHEEAVPVLERSLSIREKRLGNEHLGLATALNNLALSLVHSGASEQAQSLYERALRIKETALGLDHPSCAAALTNLAYLFQSRGEIAQALPLAERIAKIREDALGREHPLVAPSLRNLAVLLWAKGEQERARSLLERSLVIVEGRIRRSCAVLSSADRTVYRRSTRLYLGSFLRLAPKTRLGDYAVTLRFKGLLARVATAERRLARAGGADVATPVTALRAAERHLAKIANAPPSFRDKKKKAKWQEAYAKAAARREKLAVALAKDFAPLRQGLERLDLKLPDIQTALGKNAVLVDYLRSGEQYIAWVVPQKGELRRVDLGKAGKIDAAAAAFAEQAADSDEASWRMAGKTLGDLILKPLEQYFPKGTTTIHVCPDAALAAVPFGALPSAGGESLLGTKYTVSTLSMAQDLVPWEDAPKPGTGSLLLGGVNYGKASEFTAKEEPRVLVDRAPRGGKYLYLAGTKAEVEAIEPGLGRGTTTVLGAGATESLVRSTSKGKRIIHFATHGFVRNNLMRGLIRRRDDKRWLGAAMERQLAAGHDPMNLSGLAMAGANTRKGGGDDDGILTALEASHLDLDGVELVVLSACETALGTAESGEGVIGLVRGFQMAGAKQVIGSLWKVDDDATKALMVKMYELWTPKDGKKRIPAAVALKKAQEYVRSQEKWKHPYYWAAWVIWGVGD